MTHQDMIDQVSLMLRDAKNTALFPGWLLQGAKDLASRYNFRELRLRPTPITTVASTQSYSLDARTFRLRSMWMNNPTRTLWPINEQELIRRDPMWNVTQGAIYRYMQWGTNVEFYKVPDGIYTVYYSVSRVPSVITLGSTTEYTDIPAEWHPLIIQKALTLGYGFEGNPQWNTSMVIEQALERRLKPTLINRPDQTHILQSETDNPDVQRVGLDPEHFPRVS